MSHSHTPMDPDHARRRFLEMLDEAGLPRFDSVRHRQDAQMLELCWDHGFTIHIDLEHPELSPIDDEERMGILGLPPEPIHITVPGSAADPRTDPQIPGVVIHRGPPLHPDDLAVVDGLPVTSPSRTLIDCAQFMSADELRETFARARAIGLLDPEALRASRARVEWRPSLALLDEVIAEFCD